MSILIECDLGDVVRVRGTLTDEDGNAVTGATVTARVIPPGGTEASLGAATEDGSTGVYEVDFEPTVSGHNLIKFDSDDPEQAAAEGVVYVRETRFA